MCPSLPTIDQGKVSYTTCVVSVDGNYASGTIAVYSCVEDYGIRGEESTRVCGDHTLWSGAAPTCQGKTTKTYQELCIHTCHMWPYQEP